jgi:hypothetical protein
MQIKLRGASQSDNRQVSMPSDMLNFHVESGAGSSLGAMARIKS